jgi:hypothetical protein
MDRGYAIPLYRPGFLGHRLERYAAFGELKLLLLEGVRRDELMAFDQPGGVVAIAERYPYAC